MAPDPRLRQAAIASLKNTPQREAFAVQSEKNGTFGPAPTPSPPPPGPVKTNSVPRSGNGVYTGGSHATSIPNAPGTQHPAGIRGKVRMRPGETRA